MKINLLSIVFLVLITNCLTAETSGISAEGQTYRYTYKIKFIKVKAGDDLQYIYTPLPRSNDYQIIGNFNTHGGEILDNPDSPDDYLRFTILPEQQPKDGEWGEVKFEFDYTPTQTEYISEKESQIYNYDTTTETYQRYTKQYYDIIDIESESIKKISDEMWEDAANVYDYAKKCFDYVDENLAFKSIPGMWKPAMEVINNKGGSCGGLSTVLLSLLRCKQIPARHVIAYRHAWGAFYLENYGWIPVDPTFKTFRSVSEGYGLIRSHEIVYKIKLPENSMGRIDILSKTHFFFPSHSPYECEREVSLKPIN